MVFRMSQYRIHDRIKYQGSTGTLQHLNPDGSWRVWFAAKDWTGDPAMIHIDRLVKIDVKETEMEYA
jgi:hypothetical protein